MGWTQELAARTGHAYAWGQPSLYLTRRRRAMVLTPVQVRLDCMPPSEGTFIGWQSAGHQEPEVNGTEAGSPLRQSTALGRSNIGAHSFRKSGRCRARSNGHNVAV